jgi:myosin heavy subunit
MSTLIELTHAKSEVVDRLKAIEKEIIENDGEVTDEMDEAYDECLDELLAMDGTVQEKIDAYGAVMTELEQEIESVKGREKPIKKMKKSLRSRRKALQRNRGKMKERLMHYLREMNEERVEGDNFRFRRQANGGKRSVNVQDGVRPPDIDSEYTYRKFDYDAIRNALKELESLRKEYKVLRERYDAARKGTLDADVEPADIEAEAKPLYDRIQELEGSVGQWAGLGERGEHIRKF